MLDLAGSGGLGALVQSVRDALPVVVALAAIVTIALLFWRRPQTAGGAAGPGVFARIAAVLATAFTTNWQLTLLGLAAALLSFAAGWRTWDGMQNFTGEPVASLLMTFGIQAVMLIIAWLIGESFASGLRNRRRGMDGGPGLWGRLEPLVGGLVGVICAIGIVAAIANAFGAFDTIRTPSSADNRLLAFADKALYIGVGLLVLATLIINHKNDVVQPYLQSAKLIAKNAMLWVMFLLCMATGVFFSFDSFFNAIFPQSERARSAEIRSQRLVAGVVNDIGALASRRQAEEAEQLFKSAGWGAYEKNLSSLSKASQGAETEIERYFVERMEAHKSAMAAQQERIATAKSGQAGLASRKAVLTDELSRLKGERPALAAELAEKKSELDNRAKGLDAKRVEMMAEEKGAEGTLKVGQGPMFRQRKAELQQLQDAYKIQEERVRDAQKRQSAVDTRIAQIEREIAAIDGDLAKLKGEADTAEQRITVAQAAKSGDGDTPKVDPARVRAAFERAQQEFRQEPTVERLNALSLQCTQLLTALSSVPATKERVRGVDCDPKSATEAASRVFALNAGLVSFAQHCSGGSKLPEGGVDALLSFGRKCLQDSGLPTTDSSDMAAKISSIDMNRDDKAHRFVVTWNAFADGNRLAYLSLAIAIALDSLVFMAGLFGANAVRSPLTEIEHHGEMTADQLEAAIDATLGETIDPKATISALLASMHPIRNLDGFSSEIVLDEREPLVDEMRKVLNAGSNISAVRPVEGDRGRFQVHAGLTRYLTLAQRKPWKVKTAAVDRKELVNVLGVALLPDPQGNADLVLSEMHPISDSQGFAAEAYPFRIEDVGHRRLVLNTLGAGATVPGSVKRENDNGRYFVSTDFYKTLLLMRAAAIPQFSPEAVQRRLGATAYRGPLRTEARPVALGSSEMKQIESQPQKPQSRRDDQAGKGAQEPGRSPPRAVDAGALQPRPTPASPPPIPVAAPAGGAERQAPQQQRRLNLSSRLASDIRAAIIRGGLNNWKDQEIEAAWQSKHDARLEQAVWDLIERGSQLGKRLEVEIQEQHAIIDEADQHLQEEHAGDSNYLQVLETEVQKLKQLLPVLALTPMGPYEQILEVMIRELRNRGGILEDQAGHGRLSANEVDLLRGLEKHLFQLRQLPDNVFDRNDRLSALLDAYREGSAIDAWTRGNDGPPVT